MKLSFQVPTELFLLDTDLLVLGVFASRMADSKTLADVDRELSGRLTQVLQREGFVGNRDEQFVLHTGLTEAGPRRVLVVGLGKRENFDVTQTGEYGARAAREATRRRVSHLAVTLPPLDPTAYGRAARFLAQGICLGAYQFNRYKTPDPQRPGLTEVAIAVDRQGLDPLALARGRLIASGVCLARDLVNEPADVLTPDELANRARGVAKDCELDCKVLGPKEIEKLGLGLLLAAGRGSEQEPRFIHLTYRLKGKEEPSRRYALVGKGLTYSGGLALGPVERRARAKTYMAGAAAVLGAMKVLPALGVKAEVHGIIPAAASSGCGAFNRSGDVLTGLARKSIELVSTNAEGQLLMADALCYAARLRPDEIIDLATLTEACVAGLGPYVAGVMGNDWGLAERFVAAAKRVGEEVWQLPLPTRMATKLESQIADLKSASDQQGGALLAGLFLKKFVGDVPWIHIDMAGPAFADEDEGHQGQGATGFGVSALVEHITSRDGLAGVG